MGLFRRKKKNNNLNDYPVNFENTNNSDDSFLVSAISSSPTSDFFDNSNGNSRSRGYGVNSGLAYYNKYSSTNQKLASTDVVDIGAIKKPAPVVQKPEPVKEEKKDAFLDEEDILLKPVDMEESEQNQEDADFDSFFEDFMKKTKGEVKPEKKDEKVIPAINPVPVVQETPKPKKSPVQRKKKRAIDIDIISGTGGGDII